MVWLFGNYEVVDLKTTIEIQSLVGVVVPHPAMVNATTTEGLEQEGGRKLRKTVEVLAIGGPTRMKLEILPG